MWAGLISPEAPLLGLWMAGFPVSSRGLPSCVQMSVSKFPLLIKSPVIVIRTHPHDLILTRGSPERLCPQIWSYREARGFGLGDTALCVAAPLSTRSPPAEAPAALALGCPEAVFSPREQCPRSPSHPMVLKASA